MYNRSDFIQYNGNWSNDEHENIIQETMANIGQWNDSDLPSIKGNGMAKWTRKETYLKIVQDILLSLKEQFTQIEEVLYL